MSSEVVETMEEARKELEAGDGVKHQQGTKSKREPDSWQRNQGNCLRNAGLSDIDKTISQCQPGQLNPRIAGHADVSAMQKLDKWRTFLGNEGQK